MIHSESIAKLAEALSKAQGEIKGAKKDSTNPHFKSQYADLESTWEACRGPLSKHGLSVVQMPYSRDGKIGVETLLLHSTGEWIKGEIEVKMAQESNPQNAGSILTYLRRYSLQGAVGIAPEDDDANAASPKPGVYHAPAPVHEPATQPKEGAKSVDELRIELNDLAQIAVDAGLYKDLGDAVQSFTTTEKFKSKCRDVAGLTKDWAISAAIKKATGILNAKQPIDDDVPY